jgi:hypothetical protein
MNWDLSLTEGGVEHRQQFVEQTGQRLYKAEPSSRRIVPEFSPFGIFVSTRMGWMANVVKRDYLKQPAAGQAELIDAERLNNGNLVGS